MDLAISNKKLSELIGDIYQGSLTGNWDAVLTDIMDITDSNKAFFFLKSLESKQPLIMQYKANFDSPAEALLSFRERAMEDPGLEITRFVTEGGSIYVNEYLDVDTLPGTSFYEDVYKPLKTYHVLGGILCRDAQYESVYAVNRGIGEIAYSEKDKNLFGLITPHFSRAMHIFKELRLYKNYSNIAKSILDQQDKAILVCDAEGTIVLQNDFAQQQLLLPSVISIQNNKIHISDAFYQTRLTYFIKQCSALAYKDIGMQETLVIEQENADNKLITVSPLINQNAFNDIDVPCCLVTVNNQHKLNWANVQQEFGLTAKELQLIRAIYAKKKLNDLTKTFHVTYNTLRTHLQSIFRKAEVNSQTELLIKLSIFQN